MRAIGLPVPVANQFLPSRLKVVGPDASHDSVLLYVNTAFHQARKVGIEHIVFGSGGARYVPDGFSKAAARQQFVELLRKMAPLVSNYGITLCLEPLRRTETNFLNTVPESLEIIRDIDHPAVQLTFDIYHVLQEGRGAEDVLLAGDAIRHCHVAEKRDRAAPGVHGEDFTSFFAALRSVGYHGRISLECRWRNRAAQLRSAVREIKRQLSIS